MLIYKFIKKLIPIKIKKIIKSIIQNYKLVSHEEYMKTVEAYYSNLIETDGLNYEILVNGVNEIKGVKGIICEIGTRRGGSAKWIIDTLSKNKDTDRTFITIDPYGNVEYDHGDGNIGSRKEVVGDYTNIMRSETIPYLYHYGLNKLSNFIFYNLEDTEFFERYKDGIPIYSKEKKEIVNQYSLVFFDGPHDYNSVYKEVEFFNERTPLGAVYIFDDVSGSYNHNLLENKILLDFGWTRLDTSERKNSYKKLSI